MRRKALHEPWRTFFEALDQELSAACDLHCFGGFVLTEHYGVARSAIDVDVVDVRGADIADLAAIAQRAGRGIRSTAAIVRSDSLRAGAR